MAIRVKIVDVSKKILPYNLKQIISIIEKNYSFGDTISSAYSKLVPPIKLPSNVKIITLTVHNVGVYYKNCAIYYHEKNVEHQCGTWAKIVESESKNYELWI